MGTVTDMIAPDGTASMGVYLVRYDEDQWYRYDEADWQYCYDTWIKKATPLGVKHVVLQLIPDPLFPRGEHARPYTFWQHKIVPAERAGFTCEASVMVYLDEGITEIDVPLRHRIEVALRSYPQGTSYNVVYMDEFEGHKGYSKASTLMRGKVEK